MVKTSIEKTVENIFTNKNWKTWATLSRVTSLLAEAAPNSFLKALADTIQNSPKVVRDIYAQSAGIDGILGADCLYLGILSALETLSWFNTYFIQVVLTLIDLEALKTIDTRIGNSPLQSLREIFCPWHPNTMVSLDNRKQVINKLISDDKNMEVVFLLLSSLFYTPHQSSSPTHRPKFLEIIEPKNISWKELYDFYDFLFKTTLSILGQNGARWDNMIRKISYMRRDNFDSMINALNDFDWPKIDKAFKSTVYQGLTHYVQYGERFNGDEKEKSDYKYKAANINKFLEKLKITDPVEKNIQLFSNSVVWRYKEEYGKPNLELQKAIANIITAGGINAVLEFAAKIETPHVLGWELAYLNLKDEDIQEIFNTRNWKDDKIKTLLISLFTRIIYIKGVNELDKIFDSTWDDEYKKTLVLSINGGKEYWDWLDRNDLSKIYWKNIRYISADTDTEYHIAIKQLDKFTNYNTMLQLLSHQFYMQKGQRVKTTDIICVLEGLLNEKEQITSNLDVHELVNLFKVLQKRDDVEELRLFHLEIAYFDLFDDYNKVEPITVYKVLKTTPAFFMEIISNVFSEKETSGSKIAVKLYIKLEKSFPFTNKEELTMWIEGVRSRLEDIKKHDADLYSLGIQMIGKILANSPKDNEDNIWPIKYVRDVIEILDCEDLTIGIYLGKVNSIGVRQIDMKDPGGDYRQWALEFKNNADKLRFQYPNTARVLESLSRDYSTIARREEECHI